LKNGTLHIEWLKSSADWINFELSNNFQATSTYSSKNLNLN
jgi:hypothetical protein